MRLWTGGTIFLVPMSSLQLPPDTPDRVEGVLVTNGHANAYVEPLIEGWIKTEETDHRREIEFMHLACFHRLDCETCW
jgi:hypothetical protein